MQSIAFWPRPQNCTMIGIEGISHLFVRIDMEQTHKQCEWGEPLWSAKYWSPNYRYKF